MNDDSRAQVPSGAAPNNGAATQNDQRRKLLAAVIGASAVAGIAYGAYWYLAGRYDEYTDNAYVNGNVVQITPQVSGTVVAIGADDTNFVKAGQMLVQLDKADAQVALDQAESDLAKAIRRVRELFATAAQLRADVARREADLARAREDLARRERLANSGAIAAEDIRHARDAVKTLQAALAAAKEHLAAGRALVDHTTVENHPEARSAAARVREAFLAYARTALPAPVSGFIAKRSVQLGQRVSPGTPLMAVVPLDQVWVDANFKEEQLKNMRVGQPVTLTADLYGSGIRYHGKVAGFGAGTGAAFALLPAQNASGNWVKIVQRLPVRVALNPAELAAHPLEIGLSMQVDVDTHERRGGRLPRLARGAAAYSTDVFRSVDARAAQRVRDIIAANDGLGTRRPPSNHRSALSAPGAIFSHLSRALPASGDPL